MTRRGRKRQRGQAVVLFALGAVALVGFVGLVLMAGLLYWDQRELQVDSDGAALAGALQINSGDCPTSTDYTPVQFADQQLTQDLNNQGLSLASALPAQGSWTCGTAVSDNFKNSSDGSNSSYTASYTYPWNGKPYEINVTITRNNVSLPFDLIGSLHGQGNVSVVGRAVAQHNLATLPDKFALYVQNGGKCQGATGGSTPKLNVDGSIYSGALLVSSPNCAIYAHETTAFDGTLDYGDILVYADGQGWNSPNCPGGGICADGWELSGHITPTCGVPPPPPAATEYLSGTQAANADPCSGLAPDVPLSNESTYQGTEPNSDQPIYQSIGGQCASSGPPDGTSPGRSGQLKIGTGSKSVYGWGPPLAVNGNFSPGCYGYLDLGAYVGAAGLTGTPILKFNPGFYYFNGYNSPVSPGGGLCMSKTPMILLATDVTMEFVNGSSFSTTSCSSTPTSACGNSQTCDFGYAILPPTVAPTVSGTGTAAPNSPPAGLYSFEYTYLDNIGGETTPSPASSLNLGSGVAQITVSTSAAPTEATSIGVYLTSYTGAGTVNLGYLGSAPISGGSASFTYNNTSTQGNYAQPPTSNTGYYWFAAPPTSPEAVPNTPIVSATTGYASNLPAGTYTFAATYADPEGETPASASGPTDQVMLSGASNQDITISTGTAPQGVTNVKFYLTGYSGTGTVTTGYLGQIAAPNGATGTFTMTGATQANGTGPPTTNTTSSSWCSASKAGWSASDAAICSNRLLWAPPAGCTCGLSQISGTFYVKGPAENSALMGNIYWPGPNNSQPTANAAGCNYDANGIGGLLGQVICDSLFVQGGASAGNTTIGYTAGAQYSNPPEISLVE